MPSKDFSILTWYFCFIGMWDISGHTRFTVSLLFWSWHIPYGHGSKMIHVIMESLVLAGSRNPCLKQQCETLCVWSDWKPQKLQTLESELSHTWLFFVYFTIKGDTVLKIYILLYFIREMCEHFYLISVSPRPSLRKSALMCPEADILHFTSFVISLATSQQKRKKLYIFPVNNCRTTYFKDCYLNHIF